MNVTFTCPRCEARNQAERPAAEPIQCRQCGRRWTVSDATVPGNPVDRCLICGCRQLYWRKDFPHRLGLSIVLTGIVLSCVAWSQHWYITTFGVLFATAALDLVVYLLVGDVLVCYRCRAEYRGARKTEGQEGFELTVAERYRQERLRLHSGRQHVSASADKRSPNDTDSASIG